MKILTEEIESILETYSIEEILEMNDLTVGDALEFLVSEEFVELPDIKPVTIEQWDLNTLPPELLDAQ